MMKGDRIGKRLGGGARALGGNLTPIEDWEHFYTTTFSY
jgi:hypothetical protein